MFKISKRFGRTVISINKRDPLRVDALKLLSELLERGGRFEEWKKFHEAANEAAPEIDPGG